MERDQDARQVKHLYEAQEVTTTLETHREETLQKYETMHLEDNRLYIFIQVSFSGNGANYFIC